MSEELNLFTDKMHKLYFRFETLEALKKDLEYILEIADMHSLDFAKKTLIEGEIKANNQVEGYNDDIEYIDNIVKNNFKTKNAKDEKAQRVLNLYNGYKYILNSKKINQKHLDELYKILSRNLLSKYDLEHMGKHYREDKVYIYISNNINVKPDEGIEVSKVEKFMKLLLDFINDDHKLTTQTDHYIKSQIIHFYFVYIHPYFDVNGRTSRTLSIWYLLNNEIYPYIIFNRGINFDKNVYYKAILEAKKFGNLTIFIKYMLENVKKELEKEYAILEIEKNIGNLENIEKQCINYILSMKGNKTIKDYAAFYRRFNDKRTAVDLEENIIEPLIEKNVIIPGNKTNSYLNNGMNNYFFDINEDLIEEYTKLVRKLNNNN
jgi:Fic family protein